MDTCILIVIFLCIIVLFHGKGCYEYFEHFGHRRKSNHDEIEYHF